MLIDTCSNSQLSAGYIKATFLIVLQNVFDINYWNYFIILLIAAQIQPLIKHLSQNHNIYRNHT